VAEHVRRLLNESHLPWPDSRGARRIGYRRWPPKRNVLDCIQQRVAYGDVGFLGAGVMARDDEIHPGLRPDGVGQFRDHRQPCWVRCEPCLAGSESKILGGQRLSAGLSQDVGHDLGDLGLSWLLPGEPSPHPGRGRRHVHGSLGVGACLDPPGELLLVEPARLQPVRELAVHPADCRRSNRHRRVQGTQKSPRVPHGPWYPRRPSREASGAMSNPSSWRR
jgi:hypothetical protein